MKLQVVNPAGRSQGGREWSDLPLALVALIMIQQGGCFGTPTQDPLYLCAYPAPPYELSRNSPTCCRVSLRQNGEVNDTGSEVEGCLLAVVHHRDAVAVPIAGTRHATLEDGEGQPAGMGGWAGFHTSWAA